MKPVGRYFRAKDKEGLQNIYNQIDQMEKSKIEITSYKRHEELFLPFALAALAFLFLGNITTVYYFQKISLITSRLCSFQLSLFHIISV